MTKQELAEKLNGSQQPLRIDSGLNDKAREAGLVIVYGASDDIIGFDGAIRDEGYCYGGGKFKIDSKGLLPDFDDVDDEEEAQEYFERKPNARDIEALWCKEEEYAWTYRTNIPHVTFEIMDRQDQYCRGLIFNLNDLTRG